jgi:hypothetical protein
MQDDVLTPEQFQSLSRVRQQQYAERLILKLIEDAKDDGITQRELRTKTPLSISTISKYADVLLAKRQIYKVARGNMVILYANGTPLHEIDHKDIPVGNKLYSVSLIQNGHGKQIYIQEFETDDIGMKRLAGGIVIPTEAAKEISGVIKRVSEEEAKLYD